MNISHFQFKYASCNTNQLTNDMVLREKDKEVNWNSPRKDILSLQTLLLQASPTTQQLTEAAQFPPAIWLKKQTRNNTTTFCFQLG